MKRQLEGSASTAKRASTLKQGSHFANYKPSGLLTLSFDKYKEPKTASTGNFRLYTFEDHDEIKNTQILDNKSVYVVGSSEVADVVVPEASAHHCVLQSKQVDGEQQLCLVAFDKCWVNNKRVEPGAQVALADKDALRFGKSETEFLLMMS